MDFLDEALFNARLQARLKETRIALDWSHPRMADALRIKTDAYKKYENREGSAFPLYLLPRLAFVTGKPLPYWLGMDEAAPKRFRIVK